MAGEYTVCHVKEENCDYFLVKAETGTVFVILFFSVAQYWEIYVAGTQKFVSPEHQAAKLLKLVACAFALAHQEEVTPGLLYEARKVQDHLPAG